jgi:hypothetical protein
MNAFELAPEASNDTFGQAPRVKTRAAERPTVEHQIFAGGLFFQLIRVDRQRCIKGSRSIAGIVLVARVEDPTSPVATAFIQCHVPGATSKPKPNVALSSERGPVRATVPLMKPLPYITPFFCMNTRLPDKASVVICVASRPAP